MNKIDYNCYIGHWPFSKSRQSDIDDLKMIHEKNGITKGFVSSLESILYNDPMEGDLDLAKKLKGTDYEIVPSLNPMLPNIERDFRIADESFEYKAVRVYPTIHRYDFDNPRLEHLVEIANERNKAVFIHNTFGDLRMDYLLLQRAVDINKITRLVTNFKNATIVLFNLRINDILQKKDLFSEKNNIYFDMAELKHSMFSVEELKDAGLVGKMLFGSFFPMFEFSGAYIHLYGEDHKAADKILSNDIFERGF